MHAQEVILCSTSPSASSSSGPGTISLHDIQTGSTLSTFKQTSSNVHSTDVVQTRDGQGGFMLAAQADKSLLNVYNFQKDQLALKVVLPEKLSAIAVDSKGTYCAGGTSQGRVYLWEIASGIMFNAWDAHYRQVNVLTFTHDGAALISGSEDSSVNVWSLSRLLDNGTQNELPMPFCSFTDHTLPVTDILCGIGLFPSCRTLTSSADHTVKLWDPSSSTLLTTFQFPHPILALAWDVSERLFFASSNAGTIHQVNLFRERADKFSRALEAVGGAGSNDIVQIDPEDEQASKKRLISVGEPISCMTISLTSTVLIVGTTTGMIHLYDVASHQLLRSIATHKGYSITYLMSMLKPPDLVGHINLSLSSGNSADSRDSIPVRPVAAFQKMKDPKARELHEVSMMLPILPSKPTHSFFSYSTEELIRDHAVFVQPAGTDSGPQSAVSLQTRVSELESEVSRLREQLGKAKGINDTMWETVVQKLVMEGKSKEKGDGSNIPMDEDEGTFPPDKRRKRGRT
ncbi:Pre-rRNA-processing protein IPI3 [Abortiporus biennis]